MSPTRAAALSRAFRLSLFLLVLVLSHCPAFAAAEGEELGSRLPVWSVVPFVGILLSIALFPLFAPRWWHHHFPKVSVFWALIFAVPFLMAFRSHALHEILHVYLLEYIPFIILLWTLFTVSGGIHIKGTLSGTPALNLALLTIGTVIASWLGTTGASMVLIRPVLNANAWRRRNVHVVIFFIFLVSNIGGSLTPLGDPPLFLGFLIGVPFFWTMRLVVEMLVVAVPLLAMFFLIDTMLFKKEAPRPTAVGEPVRVEGAQNFLLLLGVVVAVLASGVWHLGAFDVAGIHVPVESVIRDAALVGIGCASLLVTSKRIRRDNGFSWFPIKEVAVLFAGIFMTIIPAIAILKAGAQGEFAFLIDALRSPAHYFWVTGGLSSFLDNAPSYLTIVNSCLGKFYAGMPVKDGIHALIAEREVFLKAISLGAVFFGALTYIGNAPNFMVRSISEEAGIKMPSFFGFMIRYSIPILVPFFLLITWIFF